MIQLIESKFSRKLPPHQFGDTSQAIALARLIGQDHTEVNSGMVRPIGSHVETNVHDIGSKITHDAVNLFLSGKSSDHSSTCQ